MVTYAALFDRPTPLREGEDGLHNWLTVFAKAWLAPLAAAEKEKVYDYVQGRLYPRLFRQGRWWADYCRLRVMAHRQPG